MGKKKVWHLLVQENFKWQIFYLRVLYFKLKSLTKSLAWSLGGNFKKLSLNFEIDFYEKFEVI